MGRRLLAKNKEYRSTQVSRGQSRARAKTQRNSEVGKRTEVAKHTKRKARYYPAVQTLEN